MSYLYLLAYLILISYSDIKYRGEIQGYLLITIAIIITSDIVFWGKNREYQSINPLRKLLNINIENHKDKVVVEDRLELGNESEYQK